MSLVQEIVGSLKACSDSELVSCVALLCNERPAFYTQLVEMLSQPTVPEAPHPVQDDRYVGVIKKFDKARRFGFIDCPDIHAKCGRDTFVSDMQIGRFVVGDQVMFRMTLNKDGQPQAQDLQDAAASALEAAYAGGAEMGAGAIEPIRPLAAPQAAAGLAPGGAGDGRYTGVIKKFSQEKRFGFIECPELWAQFGRDVFLSDVQIGMFTVGSPVSFTLTLNQQGHPQAQGLQDAAGAADGGAAAFQGAAFQGWASPEAVVVPPPAKRQRTEAAERVPPPVQLAGYAAAAGARHIGVIKKFWPENRYGFIDCPELHAQYGSDVFLSDKQVGPFQNGSRVSFTYEVKNGKPQAYELAEA
mmetsp:Transcript_100002/g.283042  ORF Transcript_100002/g.283042 Transcript_100002/m.283042 type:complete len:357 (+) Transcript_100002:30-1100(+)